MSLPSTEPSVHGKESVLALQPVPARDVHLRAALEAEGLPIDDLADAGRDFFRFMINGEDVGLGGLEQYGQQALLRSVVVLPHHRRQGHGEAITKLLLDHASGRGVRDVYLLTQSATAFFEHLGFVKIDRANAPAVILQTSQASRLCPASAALLVKTIQG